MNERTRSCISERRAICDDMASRAGGDIKIDGRCFLLLTFFMKYRSSQIFSIEWLAIARPLEYSRFGISSFSGKIKTDD